MSWPWWVVEMRYAGFNRALDAVRPIGSLIKPAVYLAALQQPQRYTLATSISDGPVEVAGQDGSVWQPRNFDRKSHGKVLLHSTLANSYNQATARLGMEVGLSEVVDVVAQLGVKRPVPRLPSMLLGAAALSPLEVASMYQTIASTGVYSPLRSIVDIADNHGKALARYPVIQKQVVEKPVMHLLHYAIERGINFFDTAIAYGWGGAEIVLGKAIAGRRDQVVLCTKVPASLETGDKVHYDMAYLQNQLEASLHRLNTDYVDLYLLHHFDPQTPAAEIAASM